MGGCMDGYINDTMINDLNMFKKAKILPVNINKFEHTMLKIELIFSVKIIKGLHLLMLQTYLLT